MDRKEAKETVKREWRQLLAGMTEPAKKRVNGELSYICPLCGHGKGGDGLTKNPESADGTGLKCFGCGFSGDIIDLYMQQTGADFKTALADLAGRLGISLDAAPASPSKSEPKQTGDKMDGKTEKALKTQNTASEGHIADFTKYYIECKGRINEPAAADYLKSRGITEDTAAAFNLGYDPAADPAAAPGGSGTPLHPTARIIIPVTKGHYIGRAIDPAIDPGYKKLNNKGANIGIFNESELFNPWPAIFVTEGAFNALSFLTLGNMAIALNSASNVNKLLELFDKEKPAAPLILCMDRDPAGEKAEKDLSDGLTARGIPFISRDITGGKGDNNDYLIADKAGFEAAAGEAVKAAVIAADLTGIESFLSEIYTEKYKPVPTGVEALDGLLHGGLVPQTLVLLGAEPGAGKTAIASTVFEKMAAAGHAGIYLNLEMSREQLLARSMARRVFIKDPDHRLTALDILQGYKQTETTKELVQAAAWEYRAEIGDRLQYNPAGIGTNINSILDYMDKTGQAAAAAGKQAPNFCIDYLQIITGEGDPAEIVKRAVAGFKEYAKKYNAIVFCIMAQSRAVNNRNEVTMAAGRDSSAIEYTADIQAQMLRQNEADPTEITFMITKSRFTESSMKEGIRFKFYGGQSYLQAIDYEWHPISETPFDSDSKGDKANRL